MPEYQAQQAQQSRPTDTKSITPAQKSFAMFDVSETSYHFFSQRIDLHLCDDAGGELLDLIVFFFSIIITYESIGLANNFKNLRFTKNVVRFSVRLAFYFGFRIGFVRSKHIDIF